MADGTTLNTGTGGDKIATDDLGATGKAQWVKLMDGTDGGTGVIPGDATNGLDVDVTRVQGTITVAGTVTANLAAGTNNVGDVDVLTTPGTAADGAAGLPAVVYVVGGYDGTNVQALITDSTGRLILPPTSQAGATVKTSDYDTGAGTDTVAMQGIALPKSGGAVAGGTSTDPVRTDPTGTTTQPVSGTVTASGPLTDTQLRASAVPVDTELPAAAALADAASNPTAPAAGAFAMLWNGATWDRCPGGATNGLTANVKALNGTAVDTNSGTKSAGTQRMVLATDQPQLTNALKVDGSAVTQPVSGTVTASNTTGNVASDGVDSGNPVKVGAIARTADITAVAQADRVDNISSILGKQVTLPYALPGLATQGSANYTNTTAADVIATPGAAIRLYITEVTVTNAHATVGTKVEIRDGTTVRKIVFAAANGGGASITMPVPLRLTANTALTARCVTTGADVDVSATGYTAAE